MNDWLGGRPVVVVWTPGGASAVEDAAVATSSLRDVGASAVFDRRVEGTILGFESAGAGLFRDRETGSNGDT